MSSYDDAIKELERAAVHLSHKTKKKPKKKAAAKKASGPRKKKAAKRESGEGFVEGIMRRAHALAGKMGGSKPKAHKAKPRKVKAHKAPKAKKAKKAKSGRKLNKQAKAMSPAARKAWGKKMQAARRAKQAA
jgi:hypothetical protein